MNNVEEGTYDGEEAQALFAQYCDRGDNSGGDPDLMQAYVEEINTFLTTAGFGSSLFRRVMASHMD